jgi:hypothetical protein
MQHQSVQMTGGSAGGSGSFSSSVALQPGQAFTHHNFTATTIAINRMLFGEKEWGSTELLRHVGATLFEIHLVDRLKQNLASLLSEEPRKHYPEVVGEITLLRFLR